MSDIDDKLLGLSAKEQRVLGVLLEKEATTPDQYPLTLNSVRLACNQKSSRDPVVNYNDVEVKQTLRALESRGYVRELSPSDSRVPKYEHRSAPALHVSSLDLAVITVLLLRGPQTLGEIKTRSQRMYAFQTLEDVARVCDRLAEREPPLVQQLPRQSGQKDARFIHRLGDVDLDAHTQPREAAPEPDADSDDLRTELEALRARLARLESAVFGDSALAADDADDDTTDASP